MSDVYVITADGHYKSPTKRVIIAGSRSYLGGIEGVFRAVKCSGFDVEVVISGHAQGADKSGEDWANANGVKVEYFPADWSKGRSAGVLRNAQMAKAADALIALWDGKSKGTLDMIRRMKNKPTCIYWEGETST